MRLATATNRRGARPLAGHVARDDRLSSSVRQRPKSTAPCRPATLPRHVTQVVNSRPFSCANLLRRRLLGVPGRNHGDEKLEARRGSRRGGARDGPRRRAGGAEPAAVRGRPEFRVDPFWPPPLPNNWILGQAAGVAVDADDHVWLVHRPRSLDARQRGEHACAACRRRR